MFNLQQKVMEQVKKQNKGKQHKETKKTREPNSDRKQMWELSDKEFSITVIKILKTLIGKEDNMQDKMGNFSKERKTISRSHIKILK